MEKVKFDLLLRVPDSTQLFVMELGCGADQAALLDRIRLMVEDHMSKEGYGVFEVKGQFVKEKEE